MEKPKETKVTDSPISCTLIATLDELRKAGRLYVKTEHLKIPVESVRPLKNGNGQTMGILLSVEETL